MDGETQETTFETFENMDSAEVSTPDDSNDDWSKPEPEAKKEKVSEDLKTLKDSDADADGDVIEDKEKVTKKTIETKKEEDSEDEDDLKEESKKDELPKTAKETKNIRMKMGEDLFNISPDAAFKVKVDGQVMDVPVQELINNYSGKTAWDKKFTEIGKEKKALEFETQTLTKQKAVLNDHLKNVLEPIKDASKNPLDSILYLVEMSGEDPYTAYRRLMEHNLDELGSLMDMSELERELYFRNKKDELHENVNKKRQEKRLKEERFNQVVQKADALRQTYNVSEDDFVDASEELEEIYSEAGLDVNDIDDEAVVDYASLKPHIATVKELIQPFEENISDGKYGDVVTELSRLMRDEGADVTEVKKILARNFSVEEEVKELNTKIYSKSDKYGKKVNHQETSNGSESFADWD